MDKKQLLGARIREIRKIRELSQEELAERADISTQYVSNIERGKENPTLDLLLRLAEALRVTLGQLCDFETVEQLNQKKMRSAVNTILKDVNPDRLRLALKVLRSLT